MPSRFAVPKKRAMPRPRPRPKFNDAAMHTAIVVFVETLIAKGFFVQLDEDGNRVDVTPEELGFDSDDEPVDEDEDKAKDGGCMDVTAEELGFDADDDVEIVGDSAMDGSDVDTLGGPVATEDLEEGEIPDDVVGKDVDQMASTRGWLAEELEDGEVAEELPVEEFHDIPSLRRGEPRRAGVAQAKAVFDEEMVVNKTFRDTVLKLAWVVHKYGQYKRRYPRRIEVVEAEWYAVYGHANVERLSGVHADVLSGNTGGIYSAELEDHDMNEPMPAGDMVCPDAPRLDTLGDDFDMD